MFQSKAYIERRHGKTGTDRAYYLNQLVQEYKTTESKEAKQQVLANLANFAYDPINYNTLWDIHVVDLFLDALTDSDPLLREFGAGGLANICLEPRHHEYITSQPIFRRNIVQCLKTEYSLNTKVNAMTTLMQLITAENYTTILTDELRQHLLQLQADKQQVQVSNMAALFLLDYYHQSC
ncbi:armadillo repeat-containing protein 7 [Mucor lusitanicus]